MTAEELHRYYGSWSALCHELKLGMSSYQYWRKLGYIPLTTQLLIERRTKGIFKADDEDPKLLLKKRDD